MRIAFTSQLIKPVSPSHYMAGINGVQRSKCARKCGLTGVTMQRAGILSSECLISALKMRVTRPYYYDVPCHAAELLFRSPWCTGLARSMPGKKPVNQAVGCSAEHVYRGAALAWQGIVLMCHLLSSCVAQIRDRQQKLM
jgi:hypothetical protein